LEAFLTLAGLTGLGLAAASRLAPPTAALLRSIAEVGVALLLGYVVEAVWLVNKAERKLWHENWLGFVCGLGLGGLSGIAVALATASHREAGNGNFLDEAGLWWAIASIGVLGILVVLQPLLVDREISEKS
jgi:hypothetical protein